MEEDKSIEKDKAEDYTEKEMRWWRTRVDDVMKNKRRWGCGEEDRDEVMKKKIEMRRVSEEEEPDIAVS